MQQWDIVGVIATLVALFSAVIAPMIKLTQAISRLTSAMEHLEKTTDCLTVSNRSAHEHLWENAREQGVLISDHEARIRVIEET